MSTSEDALSFLERYQTLERSETYLNLKRETLKLSMQEILRRHATRSVP
jgi:hypothetical protein